MDPISIASPTTPAPKSSPSLTIPIRIHKPTARLLSSMVTKLNKKNLGKRVKADHVIAKGLSLLQEVHFEEIKAATYSSADQLELEFRKYCQLHGSISKDEFLKKILSAAIPQVNISVQND